MDPSFLFFIFLAIGILILVVTAFVILLPKILKNLSGRGGGLTRLAEYFPAPSPLPGELFKKQTVEVGRVAYKRCTTIGFTTQGLYLEVNSPFFSRLKPLFIPWEMVKGVREGSLYWGKALILSIGEPEIGTISCLSALSEKVRPYIKPPCPARGVAP
jgi:hypothetical protein